MLSNLEKDFAAAVRSRDPEAIREALESLELATVKLDMVAAAHAEVSADRRAGYFLPAHAAIRFKKDLLARLKSEAEAALERVDEKLPCAVGL
jgi:hypothetical protein